MIHTQSVDKRGSKSNIRGYYVCSAKHKRSAACKSRWCKDKTLENSVIYLLCSLELDNISNDLFMENDSPLKLESLEKRLSLLNRKLNKWYQSFEDEQLPASGLKEHIQELERARSIIANQINVIRETEQTTSQGLGEPSFGQTTLATFWPWLSESEQKSIIHTAISRIHVHQNQTLAIEWNT